MGVFHDEKKRKKRWRRGKSSKIIPESKCGFHAHCYAGTERAEEALPRLQGHRGSNTKDQTKNGGKGQDEGVSD